MQDKLLAGVKGLIQWLDRLTILGLCIVVVGFWVVVNRVWCSECWWACRVKVFIGWVRKFWVTGWTNWVGVFFMVSRTLVTMVGLGVGFVV